MSDNIGYWKKGCAVLDTKSVYCLVEYVFKDEKYNILECVVYRVVLYLLSIEYKY
jgi:hypothetical protein